MSDIWVRRETFILAATGSAVGLGNIWRFPYIVAENGGGAFVLMYVAMVLLMCFPLMLAEVALGRKGRASPAESLDKIGKEVKSRLPWRILGLAGIITGLLIVSFYSVVGGWTLAYTEFAFAGTAQQVNQSGAVEQFANLTGSYTEVFWFILFLGATVGIIAGGVKAGIERSLLLVMPLLFVTLIFLVLYSAIFEAFGSAVDYLFRFNFEDLTGASVLAAMGQAFFSLSIGLGALMTYGAYIPENSRLGRSVLLVATTDTLVAILAGLAVFPILFSHGIELGDGGPSLVFISMTLAFGKMSWGWFISVTFFGLLFFAALSSSISLIEPAVAYLRERFSWNRKLSCVVIFVVVFVLGMLSSSYGEVFDFLDNLTANYLLPLGGCMISLFVGWWALPALDGVPGLPQGKARKVWQFLLRYVVPLAVGAVFVGHFI